MKSIYICIYPKDVQRILQKSYRASCQLIQNIKKCYGKQRHQIVTIEEFCDYTGIPPQAVINILESQFSR